MKAINILIPMHLAGQAKRQQGGQGGYAMAALLVALSIMAVMLTVVMPVWKQTAQREREEELVFRGKQYVHAIGLFQRKFANTFPPNIDTLVDQRFLRKKYKDPITNDDFVPLLPGQGVPGATAAAGQRGGTGSAAPGGRGQAQPGPATQPGGGRGGGPPNSAGSTGQTSGGIMGVTSKSKDQSIRLYNGRGHYNEWAFIYIPLQQAPGAGGAPGSATPGPPGQPGVPGQGPASPGQRGRGTPPPGGRGMNPNAPGGGRGISPFGGGGVTPVQPPPRGRF
jgi:type II secretory pathway pseudopilin PulG